MLCYSGLLSEENIVLKNSSGSVIYSFPPKAGNISGGFMAAEIPLSMRMGTTARGHADGVAITDDKKLDGRSIHITGIMTADTAANLRIELWTLKKILRDASYTTETWLCLQQYPNCHFVIGGLSSFITSTITPTKVSLDITLVIESPFLYYDSINTITFTAGEGVTPYKSCWNRADDLDGMNTLPKFEITVTAGTLTRVHLRNSTYPAEFLSRSQIILEGLGIESTNDMRKLTIDCAAGTVLLTTVADANPFSLTSQITTGEFFYFLTGHNWLGTDYRGTGLNTSTVVTWRVKWL